MQPSRPPGCNTGSSFATEMSKHVIAAAAAKKYVLSLDNATANPPADRFHSVITLITLGKAEEGENINREKFLQAVLTEFFIEHPVRFLSRIWACATAGLASGRANGNANDVHFDSQANPQSYSSARTAV